MKTDYRFKIAYIGGGSYNFGWRFISELAAEEICAEIRLYDIEKQLSLANEVIGNNMRLNPQCRADAVYLAVDTVEEALRDADLVLLSFSQGGLEERTAELVLPEAYGIFQSSAEQCGPAGVINAVKILPVFIKYAELIKELCPDAWVINMTNPMAECMSMMLKVFPQIKLFGSVNEVFPTLELLGDMVKKESGVQNLRHRDIKFNVLGICGFCWLDDISCFGSDIMPIFRQYAEKHFMDGYDFNGMKNKVKFDLFLRYGLIPATADNIVADFCPAWYMKTPDSAAEWHIKRVVPSAIKKVALERVSKIKPLMNGTEFLEIGGHSSDLMLQIRALIGKGNLISNILSANNGQIKNLPIGAIVETNALISRNSVKPVAAGELPDDILGLTLRHIINCGTIVRAVEEKDLDIAFNAFLNEPLMSADLTSATKLYKDMLSAVRTNLLYYC